MSLKYTGMGLPVIILFSNKLFWSWLSWQPIKFHPLGEGHAAMTQTNLVEFFEWINSTYVDLLS